MLIMMTTTYALYWYQWEGQRNASGNFIHNDRAVVRVTVAHFILRRDSWAHAHEAFRWRAVTPAVVLPSAVTFSRAVGPRAPGGPQPIRLCI